MASILIDTRGNYDTTWEKSNLSLWKWVTLKANYKQFSFFKWHASHANAKKNVLNNRLKDFREEKQFKKQNSLKS